MTYKVPFPSNAYSILVYFKIHSQLLLSWLWVSYYSWFSRSCGVLLRVWGRDGGAESPTEQFPKSYTPFTTIIPSFSCVMPAEWPPGFGIMHLKKVTPMSLET